MSDTPSSKPVNEQVDPQGQDFAIQTDVQPTDVPSTSKLSVIPDAEEMARRRQVAAEIRQMVVEERTALGVSLAVDLVARGTITPEEAEAGVVDPISDSMSSVTMSYDHQRLAAVVDAGIATHRVFGLPLPTDKFERGIGGFVATARGSIERAQLQPRFAERWVQLVNAKAPGSDINNELEEFRRILGSIGSIGLAEEPEPGDIPLLERAMDTILMAKEAKINLQREGMNKTVISMGIGPFEDDLKSFTDYMRTTRTVEAACLAGERDDKLLQLFYENLRDYALKHSIDEVRAVAFIEVLLPRLKSQDSVVANVIRGGNNFGMYENYFGIGDFTMHALTSQWTPESIHDLGMALRDIPTTDNARFEQNRSDGILLRDDFGGLRDFIHDQQPGVHTVVEAMVGYYEAQIALASSEADKEISTAQLQEALKLTIPKGHGIEMYPRNAFEITIYGALNRDENNHERLTNIDILRRLEVNTRLIDVEPPVTEFPKLNEALSSVLVDASEEGVRMLTEVASTIIKAGIISERVGMTPDFVKALSWIERQQAGFLSTLRGKPMTDILRNQTLYRILEFISLTSDPDYSARGFPAMVKVLRDPTLPLLARQQALLAPIYKSGSALAKKYREMGRPDWADSVWSVNAARDVITLVGSS